MLEQELKKSLERAKKYLSIVESLERNRNYTQEEENWLFKNCRLLNEEMNELEFAQLEPQVRDGYGRTLLRIGNIIAVFPTYLRGEPPMDERYIFTAIKTNLNGYIQKIDELLKNPQKLEVISKGKRERKYRIVEFDITSFIKLIFGGIYGTSLIILLLYKDLFIYGFIMNLVAGIVLLFFSFIKWGERQE